MRQLDLARARRRPIRRRRTVAIALTSVLLAAGVAGAIAVADSDGFSAVSATRFLSATRAGSATRIAQAVMSAAGPHRLTASDPQLPAPPPGAAVNVYSYTLAGMLTAVTRRARYLVYVPDSQGDGVYVINPATYRVTDYFPTGAVVQHVVPAWDLRTLYATNDIGNSLTPINPDTGRRAGRNIPVADPYNMYFTPDGRHAIVVEEDRETLAFRDPHTFALQKALKVRCPGVDHMDFSAGGTITMIDFAARRVAAVWRVPGTPDMGGVSPDGRTLWVSGRYSSQVYAISTRTGHVIASIPVGVSPHGLCVWPQPGRYSTGHTGVMRYC